MTDFRISKRVSTLPDPLTPNTVYPVRTGTGFDLYISDSTGSVAHKINASAWDDLTGKPAFIASGADAAAARVALALQPTATRALATSAQVMALHADGQVLTTANVKDAAATVTISGTANWTPDWSAFVYAEWVVTANRTVSNQTDAAKVFVNHLREVIIKSSTATARTISWGSNFVGSLPTLAVTNTKGLRVQFRPLSATKIHVTHEEIDL